MKGKNPCFNENSKYITIKDALDQVTYKNKNSHDFICEVCLKTYNKSYNLYRHIRSTSECKEKYIQQDKTITNKQVIKKITHGDTNNVIHDNVIDINDTTIIINNFGHENLNYVTDDMLKTYIKIPYNGVKLILEKIYFNEKHPENHNIKITNKKYPYVSVYLNGNWEMRHKKHVIDEIIKKGNSLIKHQFETSELEFTTTQREQYKNYIYHFENTKRIQKDLYNDVYLLLLNKTNSMFKKQL